MLLANWRVMPHPILPATRRSVLACAALTIAGACAGESSQTGSDAACDAKRDAYYAAVEAAAQCDPSAAQPCTSYDAVECPPVGVSPNSVTTLQVALSDFTAAGCQLPVHSCPIWVMTPAPYTCQPGPDAVTRCYSVCEQMIGARATCVSGAAACANVVLDAGYCSGTSMVCCSPY